MRFSISDLDKTIQKKKAGTPAPISFAKDKSDRARKVQVAMSPNPV